MDTLSRKHRLRQQLLKQLLVQQQQQQQAPNKDDNNNLGERQQDGQIEENEWSHSNGRQADWCQKSSQSYPHPFDQFNGRTDIRISDNSFELDVAAEEHDGDHDDEGDHVDGHDDYDNQHDGQQFQVLRLTAEPASWRLHQTEAATAVAQSKKRAGHLDYLESSLAKPTAAKPTRYHRAANSLNTSDCSTSSSRSTIDNIGNLVSLSMQHQKQQRSLIAKQQYQHQQQQHQQYAIHHSRSNSSGSTSGSNSCCDGGHSIGEHDQQQQRHEVQDEDEDDRDEHDHDDDDHEDDHDEERSLLMDRLDVAELANESLASLVANNSDSTLTRHGDLTCSSPCRDDFSSFMQPNDYQQESGLAFNGQQHHHHDGAGDNGGDKHDELGKMLDVHISRMDALLRLMAGQRDVSLEQTFGGKQITLSDQNKTLTCFKPSGVKPCVKVTQHLLLEHDDDHDENHHHRSDCDGLTGQKRCVWTNSLCSNFTEMAHAQQVTPELNWTELSSLGDRHKQQHHHHHRQDKYLSMDAHQRQALADRLISRLADCRARRAADFEVLGEVRSNVDQFLDAYVKYQACLRQSGAQLCCDWRQNWLFAHKRSTAALDEPSSHVEESQQNNKRARLHKDHDDLEETHFADLFAYSTLLMSKLAPKPIRLAYLLDEHPPTKELDPYQSSNDYDDDDDDKVTSSSAVDICDLLLAGCFADGDQHDQTSHPKTRAFKVVYMTSYLQGQVRPDRVNFCTHGYLFELPLFGARARASLRLQRAVLAKLRAQLEEPKVLESSFKDRVRFSVNLTGEVELVNQIPVIQFCAKISGSLPINVRWFRLDQEIGRPVNKSVPTASDWPTGMAADYEVQYETDWASRYRFTRKQSDIMFQIDRAHPDLDYNITFSCVLENACSSASSQFTLTKRSPSCQKVEQIVGKQTQQQQTGRPMVAASARKSNKRSLLLRTWSQRTLQRSAPSDLVQSAGKLEATAEVMPSTTATATTTATSTTTTTNTNTCGSSRLQSVGRLSQSAGASSDKFGKDFPYHPENLLKRLEENKFCSSKLLARRHKSTGEDTLRQEQQFQLQQQSELDLQRLDNIELVDNKQSYNLQVDKQPQANLPSQTQQPLGSQQEATTNQEGHPAVPMAKVRLKQVHSAERSSQSLHFSCSPSWSPFACNSVVRGTETLSPNLVDRLDQDHATGRSGNITQMEQENRPPPTIAESPADHSLVFEQSNNLPTTSSRSSNVKSLISRFSSN